MISNKFNMSENLKRPIKLRRKFFSFVECKKRLLVWLESKIHHIPHLKGSFKMMLISLLLHTVLNFL